MELFLLRHAHPQPTGIDDISRPLSVLGEEQAAVVAETLAGTGVEINKIYASPFQRTRETSQIIAEKLRIPGLAVSDHLVPESDQRNILAELATVRDPAVILVGHEPHLRPLLSILLTGTRQLQMPFGYATLAWVTLDARGKDGLGTLRWLRSIEEQMKILDEG